MCKVKLGLVLASGLLVSACSHGQLVGRMIGADRPSVAAEAGEKPSSEMTLIPVAYDVGAVKVIVPASLTVSERNTFVPRADIVWHGDILGDRHAQVQAVVAEAAATATQTMTTGPKVEVDIEITRFHALTPKARYTTGGNYATHFLLTVRDMETGEILDGPRPVVADVRASGGQRALEEEAAGLTQKVVIEAHLARVLTRELTQKLAPADAVVPGMIAAAAFAAPEAVSRQDFAPSVLALRGTH